MHIEIISILTNNFFLDRSLVFLICSVFIELIIFIYTLNAS